jgi:hypothetical protein
MAESIQTQTQTGATGAGNGEIVARAAKYYRWTRYLMILVLFGYGLWSIRDGFIRYPRENAEARAAGKENLPHPGLDVPFNQLFGVVLPPLALAYLAFMLHKSRGEIRLSGETLQAPGHPPVPFDAITALDQRLWERKGIARVRYEVNGREGQITLDDFVYERDPIEAIYQRVREYVAPPGTEAEAARPTSATAASTETKSPET